LPVKFGTLGHALLGLLAARPQSGYELTRSFDVSLGNVWTAKHSQIYPELAKLEAAGLVQPAGTGARGSKSYAITRAGRAQLVRWLSETPPAAQDLRDEGMLRVFFLWLVAPDDAAAYLRDQRARYLAQLARYRAIKVQAAALPPGGEGPDAEALRWSLIALEAGIRLEKALAGWSTWALSELAAAPDPPAPKRPPRRR
jgi:DNA-binding PadR family transcriptional regulator